MPRRVDAAPRMRRVVGTWGRALAVVAAIGLMAAACSRDARDGEGGTTPAPQSPTVYPADPQAEEVATGFVAAFGAFDGDAAVGYLADDADLSTTDARTPAGLPRLLALLQAMGYEQIPASCQDDGSSAGGTLVHCPFEFHAIRSHEIGLGPYDNSWFDLTVQGGEITDASWSWGIEEFSGQMWEPFRDWVRATYPEDFNVMYVDDGGNFRLSDESIALWDLRTREYVTVATQS
jgi:hypothetical protein